MGHFGYVVCPKKGQRVSAIIYCYHKDSIRYTCVCSSCTVAPPQFLPTFCLSLLYSAQLNEQCSCFCPALALLLSCSCFAPGQLLACSCPAPALFLPCFCPAHASAPLSLCSSPAPALLMVLPTPIWQPSSSSSSSSSAPHDFFRHGESRLVWNLDFGE